MSKEHIVALVERDVIDLLLGHHLTGRGVVSLQQWRRIAVHVESFSYIADLQLDIGFKAAVDVEYEAALRSGGESGRTRCDGIIADLDRLEGVNTAPVRLGFK